MLSKKKEKKSKLVDKCTIPRSPNKPISPNPSYNSTYLPSPNIAGSESQDTNQLQFVQLPPMMDGPYLDGMTVGRIKQQADDQIAYASRYTKDKAAQQRWVSLRFVQQKGKMIRANKKWTSARK